MNKSEVQLLIDYWEMIQEAQSPYLNPNITAKIEMTIYALRAYVAELSKAG